MKVSRILSRFIFKVLRLGLRFVGYFDHRFYMKLYIPLLKRQGIRFNGTPRFIGLDVIFDDFEKITIGDRVVISNEVHLLTHDYSYTTGLIALGETPPNDIAIVRKITIGDNVFIGKKSIIMPNSIIGNNVIIGSGSVIRGRIPDNSVVLGNPARFIGRTTDLAEIWKKNIYFEDLRIDNENFS